MLITERIRYGTPGAIKAMTGARLHNINNYFKGLLKKRNELFDELNDQINDAFKGVENLDVLNTIGREGSGRLGVIQDEIRKLTVDHSTLNKSTISTTFTYDNPNPLVILAAWRIIKRNMK